jgi:hypothetical protein
MLVTQRSPKPGNKGETLVQLATAVAVMGLVTVVAVYFLWVRKLGKKQDQQP